MIAFKPTFERLPAFALLCALASGSAVAADEKPIASVTSTAAKVRVEVLSLKRIEGDLVTLRWMLVNEDTKDFSMTPGNERLVDLVGRREYSAGLTGNGCRAEPGKRALCWATYAAPPATTKTVAIKFYEAFEMALGIPVTN